MEHYEVSVAVLTYKPDDKKLLKTLQSIMDQTDVRFQIVIADDGSADPKTSVAEQFFSEHNFTDYVLVNNRENRGTVYNVQSAVKRCTGAYVKLISPGDYLCGKTVLRRWLDEVTASGAKLSFSDAIYYVPQEGEMAVVSCPAHPQDVSCYAKNKKDTARYNYLIRSDLFLGATTLCRREVMEKYVDEIAGKVCYAEDHIYRLMAYDRIPVHYFAQNAVLYETSTGVSTSGNTFWQQKLQEDWEAADKLLFARCTGNDPIDRSLLQMQKRKDGKLTSKILKYLLFPKEIIFQLKSRIVPRMSESKLPTEQ